MLTSFQAVTKNEKIFKQFQFEEWVVLKITCKVYMKTIVVLSELAD
jgi:hypothetical protein